MPHVPHIAESVGDQATVKEQLEIREAYLTRSLAAAIDKWLAQQGLPNKQPCAQIKVSAAFRHEDLFIVDVALCAGTPGFKRAEPSGWKPSENAQTGFRDGGITGMTDRLAITANTLRQLQCSSGESLILNPAIAQIWKVIEELRAMKVREESYPRKR